MRTIDDNAPTILVVEDEALVRMIGADMIEEAGFHVLEAGSADEAMKILENATNVRLIFTDVDMPGSMDGIELVKLVHQRWPDVRLLLTSGHRDVIEKDLPDDGRFVPKPYTQSVVMAQIRDLLPDA